VWFAYAIGPLGTYVRVRWSYVVDLGECGEPPEAGSMMTIKVSGVEDLIVLSSIDPDLVDVVKNSPHRAVCVVYYGR
jgi:hypothetical protein